jgi:hypothetical protein
MKVFAGLCSFFCFVAAVTVPLVGQYLSHYGPAWLMSTSRYDGRQEIGFGTGLFLIAMFCALLFMGAFCAFVASEEPKK